MLDSYGRFEEALQASREGVQIHRQLAARRPISFNSELAKSLYNHLSSIFRYGPLRYSNLAHLDIDIVPHLAGIRFCRPDGSEAWRRLQGGAV
jgi:hypothetical protein